MYENYSQIASILELYFKTRIINSFSIISIYGQIILLNRVNTEHLYLNMISISELI